MSQEITKKEKDILYRQVRVMLGGYGREVEIPDAVFDDLLTVSIEEYVGYLNEWLVAQQWTTLQNTNGTTESLLFALTTKTLDFEQSFTYAYGKQTGISSGGNYELKKDYVVITAGTQNYTIPAGREINEVLWITPSQLFTGANLGNSNSWIATPNGWNMGGYGLNAVLPASNMYLTTQNTKMLKDIVQSELTYKITGGPNQTKNLWLYPVPGSRDEITGNGLNGGTFDEPTNNTKHYSGTLVWYFYYDTTNGNRDDCLDNNNDIIKLPSDVNVKNIPYQKLNDSSKTRIRRLLIAESKNYLAYVRGKFSGQIKGRGPDDVTMDYSFLLDQAQKDKDRVYDDLIEYLKTLTYVNIMEERARISEALNVVMKNVPPLQSFFMI
jgi:hypothetical protein